MKEMLAFFILTLTVYTQAYCTNYSCDVFKNTVKVTTLPATLPDNNSIERRENNSSLDPNIALAYVLCQQAGFKLISTQIGIPGTRNLQNVTKIQQISDPACTLKCTPTMF